MPRPARGDPQQSLEVASGQRDCHRRRGDALRLPRHSDAQGTGEGRETEGRRKKERLAVEADRNRLVRVDFELERRPLAEAAKTFVLARRSERDELREVIR
jgi:hypothetical protein